MLHSLSEKIADFLLEKNDDYPLEVYTYGMELIISSVLEFIILLIIGTLSSLYTLLANMPLLKMKIKNYTTNID